MREPVKTQDKGYILGFFPWSANLHGMYPAALYTIKTDSNFVPQWKKPYGAGAIPLPTGGIILIYQSGSGSATYSSMHIEKVTASGVQVWIKNMSVNEATLLNDGVCYNNKVRFVGRKAGNTGFPMYAPTSQAYTLEMDTMGNFISHSLFNTSYNGDADFSKIKRDSQGNFFVYSQYNPVSASNMTLAKFDSNFVFVWGRKWSAAADPLYLTDIDVLSNGRIFATGMIRGNSPYFGYAPMGALLKFDSQGNLIAQNFFDRKYKISGLCKKPNGNYVVSIAKGFQDSVFIFETDTSMNIQWHKLCGKATAIGTSIIQSNTLYTPLFYGSDPLIISNDLMGNSCGSFSVPDSKLTSTVGITGFTLSPTASSAAVNAGTINVITAQTYIDSCKCALFIQNGQFNVCVGNTTTLNVAGTANLSWYATAAGNSFIQAGPQFTFSSNVPTVVTLYVQDSTCSANPNRMPVNINVYSVPVLTLSPANPTICAGSQVLVTASGANTYTWSGFVNNGPAQNFNPASTTVYTVTGSVAPSCTNTKTMAVVVMPQLTLSISPPTTVCVGSTGTVGVSGANSYSWVGSGLTTPSFTINPASIGQTAYSVYGFSGACTALAQTTVWAQVPPSLSVSASALTVCAGSSFTLSASGANSYTWSGLSNSYTAVAIPTANTTYTAYGKLYNCVNSQTIAITTMPQPTLTPVASAGSVCVGGQVTLSVTGATSYTWSGGVVSNTLAAIIATNTSFTVAGTGSNFCLGTSSIAVGVYPNPWIYAWPSGNYICSGDSVQIFAGGAATYTWDNGMITNPIKVAPDYETTFTVWGTDSNSCTGSANVQLYVKPRPNVIITSEQTSICPGETATLSCTGANICIWNSIYFGSSIQVSPPGTTTYVVVGTTNGCSGTATVVLFVDFCVHVGLDSEQDPASGISVSPNPTTGNITVSLPSMNSSMVLRLYNAIGQLILEERPDSENLQINLQGHASGVYYLRLNADRERNYKIIKQ